MYRTEKDLGDDTWRQHYGSMFPAVMNQEDDSNNQRILNIISDLANKYKNNLLAISNAMIINNASGQTLTDIAKDWGVTRIDDDDDFLRFELRLQLMRRRLGVTTNDLKQLISIALNIDIKSFNVIGDENPKEIELTNVLFDIQPGPKAALKRQILIQDIQSILAPEYKLKDIQFAKNSSMTSYMAVHTSFTPIMNVKEI